MKLDLSEINLDFVKCVKIYPLEFLGAVTLQLLGIKIHRRYPTVCISDPRKHPVLSIHS